MSQNENRAAVSDDSVPTSHLEGIQIIRPDVFSDTRGFFMETFQRQRYDSLKLTTDFVQDNFSNSKKNVLRGLHFQTQHPQGKLVWVTRGAVVDVAVDIRVGSPTFGQSFSVELNDRNHLQMYVPPGFAHGFYVCSDEADFMYKCTDYHHAESEMGIAWNDPDLDIAWPCKDPIQSDKDRALPRLKEIDRALLPQYVA